VKRSQNHWDWENGREWELWEVGQEVDGPTTTETEEATHHLLSSHTDSLDREFTTTHVKEVLEVWAKKVDNEDIMETLLTKVVNLRHTSCKWVGTTVAKKHRRRLTSSVKRTIWPELVPQLWCIGFSGFLLSRAVDTWTDPSHATCSKTYEFDCDRCVWRNLDTWKSDDQHQITMRAAVGTLMGCWDEKRGEITGDRSGKKRINTFKHNTKGTFANSLANAIVATYDAIWRALGLASVRGWRGNDMRGGHGNMRSKRVTDNGELG
jgi:hypothetical protein